MENLSFYSKKLILLTSIFLLFSCSQEEKTDSDFEIYSTNSVFEKMKAKKLNVFKGPEITLGYGKVRSWVSLNAEGFPMEIGIEMTREALLNPERDKKKSPLGASMTTVPLHEKTKQSTPFDHIGFDWNPDGHEPDLVFDVPHFDIHFYMISLQERLSIPAWSLGTDDLFNNYPPLGFMPADYFTPPGAATVEPQMGKHWLPINLGAFLPFSKIMIYGSYNGKVNFVEPMVTVEELLSNQTTSLHYSQPDYFAKAGNYPTKYNIYHDVSTGKVYITLSDFVARTATPE